MDNNETTIARIRDELAICYEHIGRKAPESLPIIAASLQEAIGFSNPEHVHKVFMRAKDIESIPTQKTLKECCRNYSEEVLKYRDGGNGTQAIEYRDSREAWLPKNPVMRAINRTEAVKNYCIACGGNAYWRLCDAKARGKETYGAFMAQVMAVVARLYSKYWMQCPIANGYPANAEVTLELIPATVDDFRNWFAMENACHV